MSKQRPWSLRSLLALLAVLALVAAACGGDDDAADDTGTTTDTEETTGDTEAPDETEAPDDTEPMDDTDDTEPMAEGEGLLAEMFPDGVIRLGLADEIPYGYVGEDGEPTGEAPEVAKAVLAELGITEVDATVVDFGALIGGLQAGQYDMIAAGMFITPERAEEIIFSDPDYCGTTAFAVAEGNPLGISDFQSVIDSEAVIAVLGGAVEEGYAIDSGVPDDQITRLGDTASMFDALVAGRADAVPLTEVTVIAQTQNLDGFEATEGFVPVVDGEEQLGCGGFGFVDQELRDIFNEKLNEFKEEDRIFPIVEEFGFSQAAIDAAKDVTVEDLAN